MGFNNVRGMLTPTRLQELVSQGEIETIVTVFPDLYGRLMGKRIMPEFFFDTTAKLGMHCCNYLFTVDMNMEPVQGYRYANWQQGYGDFHCVPDMSTLRRATWLNKCKRLINPIYSWQRTSETI